MKTITTTITPLPVTRTILAIITALLTVALTMIITTTVAEAGGGGDDGGGGDSSAPPARPSNLNTNPSSGSSSGNVTAQSLTTPSSAGLSRDQARSQADFLNSENASFPSNQQFDGNFHATYNPFTGNYGVGFYENPQGSDSGSDSLGNDFEAQCRARGCRITGDGNCTCESASPAQAYLRATDCVLGLSETTCSNPVGLTWVHIYATQPVSLWQGSSTRLQTNIGARGGDNVRNVQSNNRYFRITHTASDTFLDDAIAEIQCVNPTSMVVSGNTCICNTSNDWYPNSDNTDCVQYVIPTVSLTADHSIVRSMGTATIRATVTVPRDAIIRCTLSPTSRITSSNPQTLTFTGAGTKTITFTTEPLRHQSAFTISCVDSTSPDAPAVTAETTVRVVGTFIEI